MEELVQALHATETLNTVLHPFGQHIDKHFVKPILSGRSSVKISTNLLSVVYDPKGEVCDPFAVLKSLRLLFAFLKTNLAVAVSRAEDSRTLLHLLGSSLSSNFCQAVIE